MKVSGGSYENSIQFEMNHVFKSFVRFMFNFG